MTGQRSSLRRNDLEKRPVVVVVVVVVDDDLVVVVDRFYVALFSALEPTHYALVACGSK